MNGEFPTAEELKAKAAILHDRLEWPDPAIMHAYHLKLLAHPGSAILLGLENPEHPDGPCWKIAWFSSAERDALRKAIVKVNEKRAKKAQKLTNELPE